MSEDKEFWKRADEAIKMAGRLKQAMIDKKKVKGWTKCPHHPDKKIRAVILGRRNHIHMACEVASCHMRIME